MVTIETVDNIVLFANNCQNDSPLKSQEGKNKKKKKTKENNKTPVFWTNFKQFPSFPSPSPYFGAKFQILLCLPIRPLSKLH